jgi:hypothetical protein
MEPASVGSSDAGVDQAMRQDDPERLALTREKIIETAHTTAFMAKPGRRAGWSHDGGGFIGVIEGRGPRQRVVGRIAGMQCFNPRMR